MKQIHFTLLGALVLIGCGRNGGRSPETTAPAPVASPSAKTAIAQPRPGKNRDRWKCADLVAYLGERGIKLFVLGELSKPEGDVPESIVVVDDEAASKRKASHPIFAALAAKRAGTGALMITCYRSAEFAKQQVRPGDESSLLWGRFIVVVVDPQPKGSDKESGNERSRSLVQQIGKALAP